MRKADTHSDIDDEREKNRNEKGKKDMTKSYQFLRKIFGVKINVWSLFTFEFLFHMVLLFRILFIVWPNEIYIHYTCIRQSKQKSFTGFAYFFFFSRLILWFFLALSFGSLDRYESTVDDSIPIYECIFFFRFSVRISCSSLRLFLFLFLFFSLHLYNKRTSRRQQKKIMNV